MKLIRNLLSALLATVVATTFVSAQDETILEIASGDDFTTLVTAIGAADPSVLAALDSGGPLTVFAPTNEAFEHLPDGGLEFLIANPDKLTDLLFYHVLTSEVFSDAINDGDTATTANGDDVTFSIWWRLSWRHWRWIKTIFVDDSKVTTADLDATNGVVHVIDRVLIPPDLEIPLNIIDTAFENGDFYILLAALDITDLDEPLADPNGTYTVFAPTDDAFLDLPPGALRFLLKDENQPTLAEILKYHVVPAFANSTDIINGLLSAPTLVENESLGLGVVDGSVKINKGEATVTTPDVLASNGIIHIIDSVLIPPTVSLPKDIPGVADEAGIFTTLLAGLDAAELTETLQGEGRFTVFAPTDAAFNALPAGKLDELLADPMGELKDILLYHVLAGERDSEVLTNYDGKSVRTLEGSKIDVSVDNDTLFLNTDVEVTTPDIPAVNGVIHIIDTVLTIPEDSEEECPYSWAFLCWLFGYN
mmetsp:Transcript_3842/g.10185  ORF Transcript_3842/g.10185 Transcript_3842/m.10185 type:complete len:478 (-) Transcript_3842:643-2076(-)|eukprot:CAMPEP_0198136206 /NCGR_PEP_ID=MMETSP1442-20131203/60989_1 /TAXON_ID= /ORGANISM="Craspedostauros australis, Strain CCMP3328" /LENGTH=477 /DNA_ID=CAMNT_0043797413 /DNA_START=1176 /DNA_END=2609 /DNA_ORIENTATION=+